MASSQQVSEQTVKPKGKHGTVLIIDDDEQHLKIYCWMLQRQGYECLPALVGSTSVDLPETKKVCLALLDYRLKSSLTAADVAERLKTDFPKIPIVILSELPWMPQDAQAYAQAFVHKGEHERLFETVAKFCAQST